MLLSAAEHVAVHPDTVPNPLSWLPPELPSHVKASDQVSHPPGVFPAWACHLPPACHRLLIEHYIQRHHAAYGFRFRRSFMEFSTYFCGRSCLLPRKIHKKMCEAARFLMSRLLAIVSRVHRGYLHRCYNFSRKSDRYTICFVFSPSVRVQRREAHAEEGTA